MDLGYKEWCDSVQGAKLSRTKCISSPKPNRIFGIAFGDKTRTELRFAKIHSKANLKSDFCDSESLASTAGVEPPPYGTPYAVPRMPSLVREGGRRQPDG